MQQSRIGLVGTGWRLGPYRAVFDALPEEFAAVAALTRSDASVDRMRSSGIPATTSRAEFLRSGPFDFVLLSVPRERTLELAGPLLDAGIPVLCETPLAPSTAALAPFLARYGLDAPLQSAEQYRFQPMHAARIAVARSGRLGPVHHATLSVAHEYHAMSLLRAALGLAFEEAEVTAVSVPDVAVQPLARTGWSDRLEPAAAARTVATLRFPEAFALYDWSDEQYFSPIRRRGIQFRGRIGELSGDVVRRIATPGEPVEERLTRWDTGRDGDLEGHFLRRITLGADTLWRTPFGAARLSDDELAVATVLRAMAGFVATGAPFYGIADAAEDQYLAELVAEAAATGRTVRSGDRAWRSATSLVA